MRTRRLVFFCSSPGVVSVVSLGRFSRSFLSRNRAATHEHGDSPDTLSRPSLHDPDVVINVESEQVGGMKRHLRDLLGMDFAAFKVSTEAEEAYCKK